MVWVTPLYVRIYVFPYIIMIIVSCVGCVVGQLVLRKNILHNNNTRARAFLFLQL